MYLFAENITPRLTYIVETLFRGKEVVLTSDVALFYAYDGPKITYARKRFDENSLHIVPHGLLAEKGIKKQNIECGEWKGLTVFFATKGDLPFDVFSAAFYLLSRYEEYLPHARDSYGRFAHTASLAYQSGFLQLPLVDLWVQQLFSVLQQLFPSVVLPQHQFVFQPTYDIDMAYARKGKGWLRRLMARLKRIPSRINGKDIFDVYHWFDELHTTHTLEPLYFFLVARRSSKYDKNGSPKKKILRQLIKRIAGKYVVGLHPSWQSFFIEDELHKERKILQQIVQKPITISRQHYIKFTLPHTFRSLINAGITDDYSMGYGSINGFRASYARSFYWYDLANETTTGLLLHPFCFMDANAFFEEKLDAAAAGKSLQHYSDVVQQVNGTLITIFHNHFLTEETQWQPWRDMYRDFLSANAPQTATSHFQPVA